MKNAAILVIVFTLGTICGSIVTAKSLDAAPSPAPQLPGFAGTSIPPLPPLIIPVRPTTESTSD